jgi:hypothetical protein
MNWDVHLVSLIRIFLIRDTRFRGQKSTGSRIRDIAATSMVSVRRIWFLSLPFVILEFAYHFILHEHYLTNLQYGTHCNQNRASRAGRAVVKKAADAVLKTGNSET